MTPPHEQIRQPRALSMDGRFLIGAEHDFHLRVNVRHVPECAVRDMQRQVVSSCFEHRQSTLGEDRKSTRLNSSHVNISYAVFCLTKKKKDQKNTRLNSSKITKTNDEFKYIKS